MIKTLRESKARLSELVELASRGQDVLISVRGKVKAKITSAALRPSSGDRDAWIKELRVLQREAATRKAKLKVDDILQETRAERV
jgi:prevent-host-death family protein